MSLVRWGRNNKDIKALHPGLFAHGCGTMSFRIALLIAVTATMVLTSAHSQEPAVSTKKAPTTTEIVTGGAPILTSIPSAMTTITNYYKQSVYDPTDKKIGEIVDISLDKDGKIGVLIVSVGGFLGIASKDVAVPFKAIQAMQKNGSWYLTMNATTDGLRGAPGYKYDKATGSWVPA
jgi:sporulation protein YlmC with PRC-barrel domain